MKIERLLQFLLIPALATCLHARVIDVYPTGTPSDFQTALSAVSSASPGDTVLLHAGTFDWSGNSVVLPGYDLQVGLPVSVSGITITGETNAHGALLTTISGPVDGNGRPLLYSGSGINGAFINPREPAASRSRILS